MICGPVARTACRAAEPRSECQSILLVATECNAHPPCHPEIWDREREAVSFVSGVYVCACVHASAPGFRGTVGVNMQPGCVCKFNVRMHEENGGVQSRVPAMLPKCGKV